MIPRPLRGALVASLCLVLALSARPVRDVPGEYGGRIAPSQTVLLSANADGRLASCSVERGDLVEQGQELARMDDQFEELAVRSARMRAQSDAACATATVEIETLSRKIERRAALYADGTLVGAELDELRDQRTLAGIDLLKAQEAREQAALELERAQAQLERTRVRSPIRGVILERIAEPGEYVSRSNGGALFRVATIDPLEVEVHVPPLRAATLQVGATAEVRPEACESVYLARVKQVDKVVDTASGTCAVRLVLENQKLEVASGLRCRVHFTD
ncbi:MAG: efflux RND transporter periplasmic adaptor subunit [Planctomycetes bacterium]|nr:efflux RND transporter periplasmic adaptor subunit [Planctomycetota bacterium]